MAASTMGIKLDEEIRLRLKSLGAGFDDANRIPLFANRMAEMLPPNPEPTTM